MDAQTINNLELADSSAETRNLTARWRAIVKPGVNRQSGDRWKKYQKSRFLRKIRLIFEVQLQAAIRKVENRRREQPQGFQPQERWNEQWTVDPFSEVDRSQRQQPQQDNEPGPSSRQMQHTPMEEGETDSETDPSVLEVPAVNWAKYVEVKSVQYVSG